MPGKRVNDNAQAAQHCFCCNGLAGQWVAISLPPPPAFIISVQQGGFGRGKMEARVGVVIKAIDVQTSTAKRDPGQRGITAGR